MILPEEVQTTLYELLESYDIIGNDAIDLLERIIDVLRLPQDTTKEFMNTFLIDYHSEPTENLEASDIELGMKLIIEELAELAISNGVVGISSFIHHTTAWQKELYFKYLEKGQVAPKQNLVERIDALADLIVVVYWNVIKSGLHQIFSECMLEVAVSNRTKLAKNQLDYDKSLSKLTKQGFSPTPIRQTTGEIIIKDFHTNKVLKPNSFVPPNFNRILEQYKNRRLNENKSTQ